MAVEYHAAHERAGSIRMYETLPLFSGRSTLEGVYNQASLQTHAVYFLASELDANSPNPFRKREYSQFDTESALRHLRLFGVSQVVALSARLVESLDARPEARRIARVPPYYIYDIAGAGGGYVEPLAFAPVRSSWRGWRDKSYRWFTRKPLSSAYLVFTDDPRFDVVEKDEWLAPPEVPLPPGVEAQAKVEDETITITTNRVGHPLLVKVSYHPRWKAEGADGPYLVSPALMMIVPRQANVRLTYARTMADQLGLLLTGGALVAGTAVFARRRRLRGQPRPRPENVPRFLSTTARPPAPTRRWGAVSRPRSSSPARTARDPAPPASIPCPSTRASAPGAGRCRRRGVRASRPGLGAIGPACGGPLPARGEPPAGGAGRLAAQSFRTSRPARAQPYVAQALFGVMQARAADGDAEHARAARDQLPRDFATPLGAPGRRPRWGPLLRARSRGLLSGHSRSRARRSSAVTRWRATSRPSRSSTGMSWRYRASSSGSERRSRSTRVRPISAATGAATPCMTSQRWQPGLPTRMSGPAVTRAGAKRERRPARGVGASPPPPPRSR